MTKIPSAARRGVTHSIHGHDRPDDYHWLKTQGKQDAEVLGYLKAENEHLAAVMGPHRGLQEEIYKELLSHVQEQDDAPPVPEGEWAYFTRTEEGQAHALYLRRHRETGREEVLLDLNKLKVDEGLENVWVYATSASPDGRYWAYLLDTTGQEIMELRVLDTQTGSLAEPPLKEVGAWTLFWNAGGTQLFYATDDATQRTDRIWRHTLGQPQDKDELLYQEDDATFRAGASLAENRETVLLGSYANMAQEWYALDARDEHARPELILPRQRGTEVPELTDGGDHWLLLTNAGGASEFKLVKLPKGEGVTLEQGEDVLPYDENRYLTGFHLFKNHLLLSGREGGFTRLWVLPRTPGGYGAARRVDFPEASYTVRIGPNHEYDVMTARIVYTSLTQPVQDLDRAVRRLDRDPHPVLARGHRRHPAAAAQLDGRALGAGRLHVTEGVDHLQRRIDLLHLHLLDQDAGVVCVERLLHQLLDRGFGVLPRAGEHRLDLRAAYHLAHGAFRDGLHGAFRVLDIEQVFADTGGLDPPDHREIDIDDVLVAGQHQTFFGHVAHGGAAAKVVDDAHADVDLADLERLGRQDRLDRIGPVIVQARRPRLTDLLAEAQHDADLVRLDAEEAREAPKDHSDQRNDQEAPVAETAARQHVLQLVLAAAQQFLEVGRGRPGRLRPRTPGALRSAP